jgi:multiple sugar transport system substrate-binding protein
LDALKYVRALYKETMTPEVFTWDPSANNRGILAGKLSFVCNAISVTRTAEKDNPDMSQKIWVGPALKGPVRRIAAEHVMDCYVVWDFAENKEGAKQFLADYIDNFGAAFKASEFYNFPCFPQTVPDLKQQISNDPKAKPPDKYKVLGNVLDWATNVGYPGYATAAIDEYLEIAACLGSHYCCITQQSVRRSSTRLTLPTGKRGVANTLWQIPHRLGHRRSTERQ